MESDGIDGGVVDDRMDVDDGSLQNCKKLNIGLLARDEDDVVVVVVDDDDDDDDDDDGERCGV